MVNITDSNVKRLFTQNFYFGTEKPLTEEEEKEVVGALNSEGVQREFCNYIKHSAVWRPMGLEEPVFDSPICKTPIPVSDFLTKMSISYMRVTIPLNHIFSLIKKHFICFRVILFFLHLLTK